MFSIKIISLKKDVQKRDSVLLQLSSLGLDSFVEVFDAVNGNELDASLLQNINENRRPYNLTSFNRDLSPGEIGCLFSHLAIYKTMSKGDVFLILEDDVVIEPSLVSFLNELGRLPKNWDVLLLGHQVGRIRPARTSIWDRKKNGGFTFGKPIELACGTYGYLINYQGAIKLINVLQSINAPIDHYTGTTHFINLYAIKKPLLYFSNELAEQSNLTKQRLEFELKANNSLHPPASRVKSFIKNSFLYRPMRFALTTLNHLVDYLAVLKYVRRYENSLQVLNKPKNIER